MFNRHVNKRCLIILLVFLWLCTMTEGLWAASKPGTTIKHKPPEYFKSGYRLLLNATVKDPQGIQLVRCYFRYETQADYLFVPMSANGQNVYQALLAAPAEGIKKIEYLFLIVNQSQQVVKSEPHKLGLSQTKKVPAWLLPAASQAPIVMYTELAAPPKDTSQFGDSVSVDVAESGARFGVVAGLYAGLSSSGTSALPAGTIATSTGGSSATGAVVAVIVVGAAAGGAYALAGNFDEDEPQAPSPPPSTPPPPPAAPRCADLAGSWNGSHIGYDCFSVPDDDTFIMNINSDCSGSGFIGGANQTLTIVKTGNDTLRVDGVTDIDCGAVTASASYTSTSMSGSYSLASGNGGSWMADR